MPGGACRRVLAAGRVLALILLLGCGNYDSDIAAVQRASTLGGMTNAELVLDIGGERSTVVWEGATVQRADSDDVVEVSAVINRLARSGRKSEVILRFLHDRKSGTVQLWGTSVNGEIVDLMNVPLNEFKLRLE